MIYSCRAQLSGIGSLYDLCSCPTREQSASPVPGPSFKGIGAGQKGVLKRYGSGDAPSSTDVA